MINEKEFRILKILGTSADSFTQRELAEITGYSLGTVSKVINNLISLDFIDGEYNLLLKGSRELEKYRVKNAIILAAGMTSETNPIAKNIPKGLYRVKGEVLIERLINQLQSIGIRDIYVVVGFKMDQFFYLEEKYGVHLVVNNDYIQRNNNGSLKCVEKYLGNSYIIPNDEYFTENIFSLYEYQSYYATVYSASKSKEAFVKLDDKDRILQVYKGADYGWTMLGHAYLSLNYAKEYLQWLNSVYDLYETKKLFWEEIFYPHLKEVPLYAKKYENNLIYEFDELSELEGFDNQFFNSINPEIYKVICDIFNSAKNEISDIRPETKESIDILFHFKVRNDEFVFRYPSNESSEIINYAIEEIHNNIAKDLGVDDSFVYGDRRGYRISLATNKIINYDIQKCIELVKRFKEERTSLAHSFSFKDSIRGIFEYFNDNQSLRIASFSDLKERVIKLLTLIDKDNWKKQFSHNNISKEKFRTCGLNYALVDWHFSGVNDIGYDIAALASAFSTDGDLDDNIISQFMSVDDEVKRHLYACLAVSNYYKFLLGIYFSDSKNDFSNDLYKNWKLTKYYTEQAEAIFIHKYSSYLTNEQEEYVKNQIGEDILTLEPLSGGVTNNTYEMTSKSGKHYALRIPGKGTNDYINRRDEMQNISTINPLGIMPRVVCANADNGILITEFLNNSQPCSIDDVHNAKSLQRMCKLLHMVHTSEKSFKNEFDIVKMQKMYKMHFKEIGGTAPPMLLRDEERLDTWLSYLFLNYPKELVTCHIDPKLNNFLKKGKDLYLIDWEYSGMADAYFELANFSLTNNLSPEEENLFLETYARVAGIEFDRYKFLLYKFAADYLWIYWHLIKCQQKSMIEYNEMSWRKRLKRINIVLDELEKV